MKPTKEHTVVMNKMGDGFRQFMRNGVWGTCVDCPRDSAEHAYPEFCTNATRDDHLLAPSDLFEHYESLSSSEFRKSVSAQ
jgi:hypothetical protein